MKPLRSPFLPLAGLMATLLAGAAEPLYTQDFTRVEGTEVPDEFLVLDGQFVVAGGGVERHLELPGSPLETFGVLFGPNSKADVQVRARFRGTRTGRKFPTFIAGLNGVGGFKLRVAPAKNAIELLRGDEVRARAAFRWKDGEWTSVKLQVTAAGEGVRVTGKAWQGGDEPTEWQLTSDEAKALPAGKAGVWGLPFAGTPIQFDDLVVQAAE